MTQTIHKMIGKVFTEVPIGHDSKDRFIVEMPYLDSDTNQIKAHRVRVFDPKNKKPGQNDWFFDLPRDGKYLPVKFEVYGEGMYDCQFAASALPLEEQPSIVKDFVSNTIKQHKPMNLLGEVREQVSIVKSSDIDPVGHWIDNNPEVILTKSQQRVRGKTDKELMTIVSIFAKRKGVKPCDVINAVMWESVHNGSIWKTQVEENNAES
jgi:hypothetical protein